MTSERVTELAAYLVSQEVRISANRAHSLALAIQGSIDNWVKRQKEPCECCGREWGNGDHGGCIFF